MTEFTPEPDIKTLRVAWEKLHSSGTASPTIASQLQVGIGPFLKAFEERYLGASANTQGAKLVLGMNGEGKTHLLLCLREMALRHGHAVAMLEPNSTGDSPFVFAQHVLRSIETSEVSDGDDSGLKAVAVLRAAVERKRRSAEEKGLDPSIILSRWADGLRNKDLHPFGLATALADGVAAAIADDVPRLHAAVQRMTFEDRHLTKKDAEVDGRRLLQSIPFIVRLLGFESLVILLDEAETAVEKKGSARRREFLKFLRFLFDHVANRPDERAPAMVIIGCTDDFWPEQFAEYEALRSRLTDPGKDELADRFGLTPKALVRLNKVWVRETFRGDETDYDELGAALVGLAATVHPEVDRAIQTNNAKRFARVASSDQVRRQVKRNFIKALCQTIERQVADERQVVIEETEARKGLDAARAAIQSEDEGL